MLKVIGVNEKNAESIGKTRMAMNKEVKTLVPERGVIVGVIGDVKVEPEPEVERLDVSEKKQRRELIDFLTKYIDPPMLSEMHPNPAKDRISFVKKMNGQTLGELRRFWGGKIPVEPTPEQLAELQRRFDDISP